MLFAKTHTGEESHGKAFLVFLSGPNFAKEESNLQKKIKALKDPYAQYFFQSLPVEEEQEQNEESKKKPANTTKPRERKKRPSMAPKINPDGDENPPAKRQKKR